MDIQSKFLKKRTSFKSYCLGKSYFKVLEAFTFAEDYHTGLRKDGVTPEFQHQIEIALYATTLKGLSDEDESRLLQVIMLHDVVEDYNVSISVIRDKFGDEIADDVEAISKKINGAKKPMNLYMNGFVTRPIAALAKGCDRVHNVQSMKGVFTKEKQLSYVYEVEQFFYPMLKRARDLNPQFRQAFNNIKHMLENQVEWVMYTHKIAETPEQKSSSSALQSLGLSN